MAVNLSPIGGVAGQFFTNNGTPLSGGKIYTYAAGSSTPATTYTTAAGNVAHTNPIVLDSGGRVPTGEIWLTDGVSYKFVIKTSADVLIGTYDNIVGINSNFVNYTNQQDIQTATAGQTLFTLPFSYAPGTNSLSVFVDGVNQYGPGAQYAYVETSSTEVTFTNGLHVGAEVKFTTSQLNSSAGGDASQVSYTPAGTSAVTTNVQAKLRQTVSVTDFGADPTGVADSTTFFQNALASVEATIYVPPGTYRIDGTILPPARTNLFIDSGATLKRVSAAISTDPIIRISDQFISISGRGMLLSEKDSPLGLLYVGALAGNTATVTYCQVQDITLYGNSGATSIGLYQYGLDSLGAYNYYNRYQNITSRNVNVGVYGTVTNACDYNNILFSDILTNAYEFVDCNESTITGGFTHSSPNCTVIRVRNVCVYMSFIGVQAEPGGLAKYFVIDATCSGTQIIGQSNCAGGYTDNASNSTVVLSGDYKTHDLTSTGNVVMPFDTYTQVVPTNTSVKAKTYTPYFYSGNTASGIKVSGLNKASTSSAIYAGVLFEVSLSGYSDGGSGPKIYYAKKYVTAYNAGVGDKRIDVQNMITDSSAVTTTTSNTDQSISFALSGLSGSTRGQVIVEVRAVGDGIPDTVTIAAI